MAKQNYKKKVNNGKKSRRRVKVKGGLKQTNPSLTSFQAVYKMIHNPNSVLTKISCSSLKGFIFKLDVPATPENSEFYGLNSSGTEFNSPIYSLIFKFAIISNTDEMLPELSIPGEMDEVGEQIYYDKETEDLVSYRTESKIQQTIYYKTLNPSGNPICLAVVDFSYFDKDSAVVLLNELLAKQRNGPKVSSILNYLIRNIKGNRNRRLGMITMQLLDSEYVELADLQDDREIYNSARKYALAQIYILFTKLKVMNYDCHSGNVLAKVDGSNSFLIDFGRTLNLNEADPFPSDADEIIEGYKKVTGRDFYSDFEEVKLFGVTDLYAGGRVGEDEVIDRMQKIIKFMAYLDYVVNHVYFDMTKRDRPQMIVFLRYLYGSTFSMKWSQSGKAPNWTITERVRDAYLSIIPLIQSLTQAPLGAQNRLSDATLQRMIRDNELFTIRDDVSYDRSNTSTWITKKREFSQSSGFDVEFGGKKTKKHRKRQ